MIQDSTTTYCESVETSPISPFAVAAPNLVRHGLAVLPCTMDGTKKPLVSGWTEWFRPPSRATVQQFIQKFPSANIGIRCDLSGVTVVDVDGGEDVVKKAIEIFGDTPMKVRTPRGGTHLWYRHNGERNRVRCIDNLPIDIRGKGGYVIVPPSIRVGGGAYNFVAGDWNMLRELPGLGKKIQPTRSKMIGEGRRNNTLFRELLRQSLACDNFEAIVDVARNFNDSCVPPLPDIEVIKTAKSAWLYEVGDRNWNGGTSQIVITGDQRALFGGEGDAFLLFAYLRQLHGGTTRPFAVSTKAMAAHDVIAGWSGYRYRKALQILLKCGPLLRVHRGGSGPGDTSKYELNRQPPW